MHKISLNKKEKEVKKVASFFKNEISYYRGLKSSLKEKLDNSSDLDYFELKKQYNAVQNRLDELTEIENNLLELI